MNIVFDWIIPVNRHRRRDPATSRRAAAHARTGAAQALRERIYAHLARPHTAREVAAMLCADFVAVSRRMSEIPGIHRTGEVRDGCAVWARDDGCYFAGQGDAAR